METDVFVGMASSVSVGAFEVASVAAVVAASWAVAAGAAASSSVAVGMGK
ncbi:MAG: hypothetical protein ABRQ25_18225 [Clostridiaceae bacterium]